MVNCRFTHKQLEESTMSLFAIIKKPTYSRTRRPGAWRALAVAGTLLFGGSAAFADYEAAVRALESGNYRAAMTGLNIEAEQGHAEAQRRLGEMYRQGQGTTADPIQAIKWLTLRSEEHTSELQSR